MATEDQQREARRNGWVEEPGWKGDPAKWVDADVFLERAETFVPFLKAQRAELEGKLSQSAQQIAELSGAVKAGNAAIAALQESHDADTKEQVEAARKALREEIKEASAAGDHEALATATANLSELDAEQAAAKLRGAEKPKPAAGGGAQVVIPPEVTTWMDLNKDFMSDMRKASLAQVVAAEMRAKGDGRKGAEGAAFLDDVRREVERSLGGGQQRQGDGKASEGGGGGGRSDASGGSKTYADLPKEAKDACDRQSSKLVGPNRAHKTVQSWRDSYTKQYFQGDQ